MHEQMTLIQHELDAIAAEHGCTYVGLHRHTHDDGRKFYSVNLHADRWVRSASADTLADALSKAVEKEPRYCGPDREAA